MLEDTIKDVQKLVGQCALAGSIVNHLKEILERAGMLRDRIRMWLDGEEVVLSIE